MSRPNIDSGDLRCFGIFSFLHAHIVGVLCRRLQVGKFMSIAPGLLIGTVLPGNVIRKSDGGVGYSGWFHNRSFSRTAFGGNFDRRLSAGEFAAACRSTCVDGVPCASSQVIKAQAAIFTTLPLAIISKSVLNTVSCADGDTVSCFVLNRWCGRSSRSSRDGDRYRCAGWSPVLVRLVANVKGSPEIVRQGTAVSDLRAGEVLRCIDLVAVFNGKCFRRVVDGISLVLYRGSMSRPNIDSGDLRCFGIFSFLHAHIVGVLCRRLQVGKFMSIAPGLLIGTVLPGNVIRKSDGGVGYSGWFHNRSFSRTAFGGNFDRRLSAGEFAAACRSTCVDGVPCASSQVIKGQATICAALPLVILSNSVLNTVSYADSDAVICFVRNRWFVRSLRSGRDDQIICCFAGILAILTASGRCAELDRHLATDPTKIFERHIIGAGFPLVRTTLFRSDHAIFHARLGSGQCLIVIVDGWDCWRAGSFWSSKCLNLALESGIIAGSHRRFVDVNGATRLDRDNDIAFALRPSVRIVLASSIVEIPFWDDQALSLIINGKRRGIRSIWEVHRGCFAGWRAAHYLNAAHLEGATGGDIDGAGCPLAIFV